MKIAQVGQMSLMNRAQRTNASNSVNNSPNVSFGTKTKEVSWVLGCLKSADEIRTLGNRLRELANDEKDLVLKFMRNEETPEPNLSIVAFKPGFPEIFETLYRGKFTDVFTPIHQDEIRASERLYGDAFRRRSSHTEYLPFEKDIAVEVLRTAESKGCLSEVSIKEAEANLNKKLPPKIAEQAVATGKKNDIDAALAEISDLLK